MHRADGYRVTTNSYIYALTPYIMDKRYDASNQIMQEIDYDLLHNQIKKYRSQGIRMSHMAIIIAAYLRVVSQNPYLNRFAMNKKVYARNHFCISFVSLSKANTDTTTIKVYFNLDDDIFTVNQKINDAVDAVKEHDAETSMDKIANKLLSLPGLPGIAVSVLKFIDKHFWLPMPVIDASPFHTSFFITNLASIRTNAIFHHLYEFGTTGIFCSMGVPKTKVVSHKGEFVEKKVMELGIVTDERIADGHYYGRCFRELMHYLNHIEILESKPESVVLDSDIKNKKPKFIWNYK